MAKKRFISSFLLCAFAILFAHTIIPHHHHEEADTEQHNSHHGDDHDDIDHDFLGHAFSYFEHEKEGSIIYETASPSFECSKVSFDKDAVLLVNYIIRQLHKPPLIHKEVPSITFTLSFYSNSRLFRGPPMA